WRRWHAASAPTSAGCAAHPWWPPSALRRPEGAWLATSSRADRSYSLQHPGSGCGKGRQPTPGGRRSRPRPLADARRASRQLDLWESEAFRLERFGEAEHSEVEQLAAVFDDGVGVAEGGVA